MTKITASIIKEAVESKRFSYRQLAKLTNIDHAYLCNIAKGKKSPPKNDNFYQSLSDTLGLQKEDFLEYQSMIITERINNDAQLVPMIYEYITTNSSTLGSDKEAGLTIDADTYEVRIDGRAINLTYKEFELLTYLYKNPNKVIRRDTLLSQIWGFDYFGGTRTVDVHIRRLRAKLEPNFHDNIKTVRNIGYKFVAK